MDRLSRRRLSVGLISLVCVSGAFAAEPGIAPPGAGGPRADEAVVVFAAASLKTALDVIGTRWMSVTGKKVTFSYAASGPLAKQIENGAPADIFASADIKWMDYVADHKLLVPDSRKSLLGNKLVLIAPKDEPIDLKIAKGFRLAEAIGDSKLATGDPRSVPVGSYAQAALTSLGVWDAVSPKIAGSDSVRGALAFVARGEARLGIVYATDAHSEPKVKIIDTFPADSHPPIVYPFAVVASSKNPAAAEFLAFLSSPDAQKAFEAEGFTILP